MVSFAHQEGIGPHSISRRAHCSFTAVMNYTEMESKVFIDPGNPLRQRLDLTRGSTGSRSYEQRAVGGIVDADAGDCQCDV